MSLGRRLAESTYMKKEPGQQRSRVVSVKKEGTKKEETQHHPHWQVPGETVDLEIEDISES